ncbi:MAG: peptidyl-prolyl cis-trans isomerase [Hyphomonadaceae bacterium]
MGTARVSPPVAFLFGVAATLLIGLGLSACGLGRDNAGDGAAIRDPIVAATVNGRPIYIEDVRSHAVMRGWLRDGEDLDGNSQAFYQALEELIEIRLFAMEAEARGLDREPDVRRQLENARERVLASSIYEDIAQRAADPEAVERLYRDNASRLNQGEEVHLRQLVFASREAAEAAKRRLDQGERFEALAFELNTDGDGGDLGFVSVDDLAAPVRDAINRASNGELIGPLEIGDRFLVMRLDDRRALGGPSLEQLRPRIIAWLAYQEATQLNERLARDVRIERLRQPEDDGMAPAGEVTAPADAPTAPATRPAPSAPPMVGEAPPFPFPGMAPPTTSSPPAAQPQPQAAAPPPATPTAPAPEEPEATTPDGPAAP